MSEPTLVNYAAADAWKQRAESTARAERAARQSVEASLRAMRARGVEISHHDEEARQAAEAAARAAREAEQVWADTAQILRSE